MDAVKKPVIAAVSGVKNSGKTTFLEKLVKELTLQGYKVAVIKHDGHEFSPDTEGTDTWRLQKAGAYGTAIFSKGRWMVVKEEPEINEQELMKHFPEAEVILLEGFKNSGYPKFEIVRKGNSKEPVCDPGNMIALVTDTEARIPGVPVIGLEDWKTAVDLVKGL